MQFFWNFHNYSVKIISLTEVLWDFQNNALWDTHENAPLNGSQGIIQLVIPFI